jgi:hypothetical protein
MSTASIPAPPRAVHTTIDSCRACAAAALVDLHAFGPLPLANALRPGAAGHGATSHGDAGERRVPLTLALCPSCSLLQLRETVDPEVLFADYRYFSSYAATTLAYAEALAAALCARLQLGPRHRVVEVASNDGYLLRPFQSRGVGVLGIEPAANVAAVAREHGVPTEVRFFGRDSAAELRRQHGPCDLLLANNVLAHVADLPGFVAGMRTMLADTGTVVCEFPYVGDLLAHGEFDTIYHEHLCYFSLAAVQRLFAAHGLFVTDVQRLARHGGSLRVFASPQRPPTPAAAVLALLHDEAALGLHRPASYRAFVAGIARTRMLLQQELRALRAAGKTVAAYGASAKGSTLMMSCGITHEQIAFVADKSPHKQGRRTPGNHVPIVPTSEILQRMPDVLLLLTWNFADEILAQEAEYRRRGGRFLLPVPEVRYL